MQKNGKIKAGRGILLTIIIAMFTIYYGYIFANEKQGHHGDECWSYGYSNGYHYGLVYEDDDGNTINQDQWLSNEFYRGYLEVQEDQRFCYESVVYNLYKDKTTSPLYYFALHTICSFFPDSFSWWYGYAINIVSFVVIFIALFGFAKQIVDSDLFAFAVCIVYGFSTGAASCAIYIRAYAMMIMFEMISLWLQSKMFHCDDQKKHLRLAIVNSVIVVLGTLTHYYFLTLLFFVAAFTDIYYLIKKKWSKLITYSVTMLAGVGVGFLIWPKMFADLLRSGNNFPSAVPFRWDFSYLVDYCLGESTGIMFPIIDQVIIIYYVSTIVVILLLWGIPSFLFRNEQWFKNFRTKVINLLKRIGSNLTKGHAYAWILFLAFLFAIAITAKTSYVFMMSYYANRYVFQMMPVVVVILGFAVYAVAGAIAKKKAVAYTLFLSVCAISMTAVKYTRPNYYLFERNGDITLGEFAKDENVVLAMVYPWKVSFYAEYLLDSKQVYATSKEVVMADDYLVDKVDKPEGKLCFVVEESIFSLEQNDGRATVVRDEMSVEEFQRRLEEKFDVKLKQTHRIFYTGAGYLLLFESE